MLPKALLHTIAPGFSQQASRAAGYYVNGDSGSYLCTITSICEPPTHSRPPVPLRHLSIREQKLLNIYAIFLRQGLSKCDLVLEFQKFIQIITCKPFQNI